MFTLLAVMVGGVVGSLTTTAAMRSAQRRGWLTGRSECDSCNKVLPFSETVPILSFLILRGRCRSCGAPIGWLHPVGETAGVVIFLTAIFASDPWTSIAIAALGLLLLYVAVFDWLTHRIPNTLSAAVLIVCFAEALRAGRALDGALAAAAVLCLLAGVGWIYRQTRGREGLGGGDVKLLAALAMWLGMERLAYAVALSAGLALIWMIGIRRLDFRRADGIAFGPFIAIAGWAIVSGVRG